MSAYLHAARAITSRSADRHLFLDIGREPDATALWRRWIHQFPNGREYANDRLVVAGKLSLELPEFERESFVGCKQFPDAHKRTHNLDVDGDCALTVEYGGQHCDTLLGKRVG